MVLKIIRRSYPTWSIFLRSVALDEMAFYKNIIEATTYDPRLIGIMLLGPSYIRMYQHLYQLAGRYKVD